MFLTTSFKITSKGLFKVVMSTRDNTLGPLTSISFLDNLLDIWFYSMVE